MEGILKKKTSEEIVGAIPAAIAGRAPGKTAGAIRGKIGIFTKIEFSPRIP